MRSVAPRRVLIAGSGTAGLSLAADMTLAGEEVVGFLDDGKTGPQILGRLDDVQRVSSDYDIQLIAFAIPSASPELLRNFLALCPKEHVEVAVVPHTYKVVSRERVSVTDLTDVDVLDMVGRAPVKHDMEDAQRSIAGKRVLVTGAAGSIGSRILTQLAALDPAVVVGVDRSESGIFHLGESLKSDGNDSTILEIGDVQSRARMENLIRRYEPELLFHVAAYKHVPLMQSNAIEAFNNNVWGTLNVLETAQAAGVARVVSVSTDKAVHPTNVMGATKRLGELLLRELASQGTSTVFSAVRFGNVLESEGSVMQTFRRQLLKGKNLTVTHRDVTRYFMTIDEASQLVIQTASRGRQGDLFVLDMGEPIRVYDLALGLISAINPQLDVDIIGLRPGEKMFEELSYQTSRVDSTTHPKVFIVTEEDDVAVGSVGAWTRDMLQRTLNYEISEAELIAELKAFGFSGLQ